MALLGVEQEQRGTAHSHHGGGDGGPVLRMVGEQYRERQQQCPSGGEAQQHQPVDDRFGPARRHDDPGERPRPVQPITLTVTTDRIGHLVLRR